nr:hypothetical protein GCM10017544_25860 [Microbacterium imperiale]
MGGPTPPEAPRSAQRCVEEAVGGPTPPEAPRSAQRCVEEAVGGPTPPEAPRSAQRCVEEAVGGPTPPEAPRSAQRCVEEAVGTIPVSPSNAKGTRPPVASDGAARQPCRNRSVSSDRGNLQGLALLHSGADRAYP